MITVHRVVAAIIAIMAFSCAAIAQVHSSGSGDASETAMEDALAAQARGLQLAEAYRSPPPVDAALLADALDLFARQVGDSSCGATAHTPVLVPARSGAGQELYLLNTPGSARSFPLGGHYRLSVAPDGELGPLTDLSGTCESIAWDPEDPQLPMRVYVTTYAPGSHPNEIHSFVSSQLPMSLGVITGELIWPMAGGYFAPPVPASEAGY